MERAQLLEGPEFGVVLTGLWGDATGIWDPTSAPVHLDSLFFSLTSAFYRQSLPCCNPELLRLLWCRGSESALC